MSHDERVEAVYEITKIHTINDHRTIDSIVLTPFGFMPARKWIEEHKLPLMEHMQGIHSLHIPKGRSPFVNIPRG